jgi:predicted nucleic acid-binding protein
MYVLVQILKSTLCIELVQILKSTCIVRVQILKSTCIVLEQIFKSALAFGGASHVCA